jgi:hypothetical protein
MGQNFGRDPEWDPKFQQSGLGSGLFSSTWRQLNLNFLDMGFSLRCKGSITIDKPSLNVLGLLRCVCVWGGVQIGRCVKVHHS